MTNVIPGILEKDLTGMKDKIALVAPHVSWVQIDIADGTLINNKTFVAFEELKPVIASTPKLSFEAHLMVASPEKYIHVLVDAGFKRLIAHVESDDPRLFLDEARLESAEVGLAIDGATEIEQMDPFLEEIDMALVMTIEAGFSGQPFLPETVEKVRVIRKHFADLPIEVDGGINAETARLVKDAGANRLVSTSFLFKDPSGIAQAVENLKNA